MRHFAQQRARLAREQARGFVVERERALGKEIAGAFDEIDQGLGALFQTGHGRDQLGTQLRCELGGQFSPAREMPQYALDFGKKVRIGHAAQVVAIQIFELGEVEARR